MRNDTPQPYDRHARQNGIGEEAARWLCELREADSGRQAEFLAWLRRSPQHVEEFLFATAMWQQLRLLGMQDAQRIESMLAAAERAVRESGNVVGMELAASSMPLAAYVTRRMPVARKISIAAAALIMVAATCIAWIYASRPPMYVTGIGEQRTVRLEDGSRVDLNTRSRIEVRYSAGMREIRLLDGEALFTVSKDSKRAFRVQAGEASIQALGTQFNVYRQTDSTKVSVIEGRVRLADAAELSAGQEARIFPDGRISEQTTLEIDRAVAWRERRLVFRSDRLAEVAAEVNRYSARPIRIEGDAARNLRLTAIFDADDPDSLVRFLGRMENLSVEKTPGAVRVSAR